MVANGIPPKAMLGMENGEVRAIREEGDELAQRLDAMRQVAASGALNQVAPIDAHLFVAQISAMDTVLRLVSIRLARANDAAKGVIPDTASALTGGAGGKIIKPN